MIKVQNLFFAIVMTSMLSMAVFTIYSGFPKELTSLSALALTQVFYWSERRDSKYHGKWRKVADVCALFVLLLIAATFAIFLTHE